MPRITTNVLNNATVAAGYIYGANPAKADLSASTSINTSLEATVTSGVTPPKAGDCIKVHYAFSNTDIAVVANAPAMLYNSESMYVRMDGVASSVSVVSTKITVGGNYLYAWVESVNLSQPVTLALNAIQL